jgi:hypothetical protein
MTTSAPAFTYIHVPGCDCPLLSPDGSGVGTEESVIAYARGLRVAREAHGDVDGYRIPLGSCLAWLDDAHSGQGWPNAHRDYHVLALYCEAVRLRGSAGTAWAAVEDARRRRGADPATTGYDGWSPAEREAWDRGLASAEALEWIAGEDARLCYEHTLSEREEARSTEALAAALQRVPWGAQPDGSFVTRQTRWIASSACVSTLHAPGKQGPLAEAVDDERGGGVSLRVLRTRAEALAVRATEKRAGRENAAAYALRLRAAGVHIRRRGLPFTPGQEYGYVRLPSGDTVSARGALRAAGLSREAATALLDAFYALPGEEQSGGGLCLTLRGVERVTSGSQSCRHESPEDRAARLTEEAEETGRILGSHDERTRVRARDAEMARDYLHRNAADLAAIALDRLVDDLLTQAETPPDERARRYVDKDVTLSRTLAAGALRRYGQEQGKEGIAAVRAVWANATAMVIESAAPITADEVATWIGVIRLQVAA